MMGGGFGGSVIAICRDGRGPAVAEHVIESYKTLFLASQPGAPTPPDLDIIQAKAGPGAQLRPIPDDDDDEPPFIPAVDLLRTWAAAAAASST